MILTSLLVAHGIICVLGAFLPFYPPVFLFYWFLPGPFAMKLVIVLVVGVLQVVFGIYLILKRKGKLLRWYWLAVMVVVPVLLLLVFPIIDGQFP